MDWTDEHNKLVYSAMKKATSGFSSLPRGYEKEDMIQEGAVAVWQALEKGGHDPKKGALSTFMFKVVKDKYRDLIRAANRDKRKAEQETIPYDDQITGAALLEGKKKNSPRDEIDRDYYGENDLNYNPVTKREPINRGRLGRYRLTGEKDLTPYNAMKILESGNNEDIEI